MMSDKPTQRQQELIDSHGGFILVDAGPGTGKTTTIVNRYIDMLESGDATVDDFLMLSFTENAANALRLKLSNEMRSPRKDGKVDPKLFRDSKKVKVRTFDSFCRSIVTEGTESVSEFFGFNDRLSRSASLSKNDSLNQRYFERFFNGFMETHGADYGDVALIAEGCYKDILAIIEKLMSRGVIPKREGWFGYDHEKILLGDQEELSKLYEGKEEDISEIIDNLDPSITHPDGGAEQLFLDAVNEDRTVLLSFIHDVYYDYIRSSIRDNRLTFSLTAMFALVVLYSNKGVRERNSFRYLTIDEFQDTNANQMMIAMMVLNEGNQCAVGDWKQGIYGFRNVTIENITDYENRLRKLDSFLNDGEERVRYPIDGIHRINMDINHRSTDLIIRESFRALDIEYTDKRGYRNDPNVVRLTASEGSAKGQTDVRYVRAKDSDSEISEVVKAVKDYVTPRRYTILEDSGERLMRYSDVAVLCPRRKQCRAVMVALRKENIPAFMQGDVEIMDTREGKLALAWLKLVNNRGDREGYVPIMVDFGYNLTEIASVGTDGLPDSILGQLELLRGKRRRMGELMLSIFSFYGDMDPDIVQAIITAVSTEHRGGLMTISDVIDMIERDIRGGRTYGLEPDATKDAVKIMTMHKSKGLEFGAVIIPFVDNKSIPSNNRDRSAFICEPLCGLRAMKSVYHHETGTDTISDSWSTAVVRKVLPKDYDEDRRLLFVAMSRAKQYLTVVSNSKAGSGFFGELCTGDGDAIRGDSEPYNPKSGGSEIPAIGKYTPRRRMLGVHDIMDVRFGKGSDEICGKGPEYGTMIHEDARLMQLGRAPKEARPEHAEIRRVLDGVKDADLVFSEVECILPVEGTNVSLKGVIDLVAVYPDWVEIHDYKTDAMRTPEVEREYMLQLSVYAYAAMGYYGKEKAVCVLDYVSLKDEYRFEPVRKAVIRNKNTSICQVKSD